MTMAWNRRMFLATAGGVGITSALGAAAMAAGGDPSPAPAPAAPAATAVPATYVLPNLPYGYAALEGVITAEVLHLHHDKHHAAYVTGANTTLDKLAAARAANNYDALVGLEKTLAFNLSGHVLHSIFWMNLGPYGGGRPLGALADAINGSFGSFDAFMAQLTTATTGVQGSGWGALVYDPMSRRLLVEQIYDHQGNVGFGTIPLLVFDAWEHAYYLQYKNVRADWVKKLWDIVNWNDVAHRYASARKWNFPH
ncbi:MAG TPA: superoxide dismutase [Kineosporiaceae bacterium]|nr:superoxide dismutase [Kineosporiaceae bacterium]